MRRPLLIRTVRCRASAGERVWKWQPEHKSVQGATTIRARLPPQPARAGTGGSVEPARGPRLVRSSGPSQPRAARRRREPDSGPLPLASTTGAGPQYGMLADRWRAYPRLPEVDHGYPRAVAQAALAPGASLGSAHSGDLRQAVGERGTRGRANGDRRELGAFSRAHPAGGARGAAGRRRGNARRLPRQPAVRRRPAAPIPAAGGGGRR